MSTKFPANLDDSSTFPATVGGDTANTAGTGKGLSPYLNDLAGAVIAAQTKIGSSSSAPTSGKVLRATGAGTSAWGQLVMSTDVAAFSSADLRGVLSDETGTGAAVFATSPTIVTPTIASFTNANHNHSNSAGGGKLTSAAITSFDTSLTTVSNPYKFRVSRNAAANSGNGVFTTLAFDTEQTDTNNNVLSGVYTVPVTGFYQFNWHSTGLTSGTELFLASLFKNGTETSDGSQVALTTQAIGSHGSDMIGCTAGDTIDVRTFQTTGRALIVGTTFNNYFSGFLVSTT